MNISSLYGKQLQPKYVFFKCLLVFFFSCHKKLPKRKIFFLFGQNLFVDLQTDWTVFGFLSFRLFSLFCFAAIFIKYCKTLIFFVEVFLSVTSQT